MVEKVYESGRHQVVIEDRTWVGKPVLAFLVRASVYVVPIAASVLFSIWLSGKLPSPQSAWQLLGWWAAVIAGSTGVLVVFDKLARRLLPLAALLQMTMVFPDRSPSRFKTAMRSGSSIRNLREQIGAAEADHNGDASVAAETILRLASALNAHDPHTRGHSERVRAYSEMLAEQLGVSEEDRAKLRWSSLLHDIGKLQVPAEILDKAGRLDDDEWDEIRRHPKYGVDLAGPVVAWLGEWAGAIEDHHERFDGFGYPKGKAGEAISLGGRIVAVADAYDVMTSARSYKKPIPAAAAREELARHAGAQFDPVVVRAFLELALGRLQWIAGPLSWLAQLPFLRLAGSIHGVGSSVGVAAAATTGAAVALAGGLIDVPNDPLVLPPPPQALIEHREAPPAVVAVGDTFTVPEDHARALDVLVNDGLIERSELSIIVDPEFGTVIVNPDGTVTYLPTGDYVGTDTFTYEVTGPDGSTSSATVTVTVEDVNDHPVAVNDGATIPEDTTATIPVLANDLDAEGFDPATLAVRTPPRRGMAVVAGSDIVYTPRAHFNGTDEFTYVVADTAGVTAEATVAIEVLAVNDVPSVPGPGVLAVDDGGIVSFDPLAGATDVEGDGIFLASYDSVSTLGGTIVEGSLIYTAPINVTGTDSFSYIVSDGTDAVLVPVAVRITDLNHAPVFGGVTTRSLDENTSVTIEIVGATTDRDGDRVAIGGIDTTMTVGRVVANAGGTVTYRPARNWAGTDGFTVSVTDGENVVPVPFSVTVNDVVVPPTLDPIADIAGDEGTPIVFTATAEDPDGGTPTFTVEGAPQGASMTTAGSFAWTPGEAAGPGSYTFDVVATDADGEEDRASVTITVAEVNAAPVLEVVSHRDLREGDTIDVPLLAVDGDVPANTLTFTLGTAPSFATLTDNRDGTAVLRLAPGYADAGSHPLTVTVTDDGSPSLSASRTFLVAVADVNRPPVGADQTLAVAENSGATVVVGAVAASDPDSSDSLTYAITGPNPGFVIDPDTGVISVGTVVLDHETTAAYTLTVEIADDGTPSRAGTATVTVDVLDLDEAPVAADQSFTVAEASAAGTVIGTVAAVDEDDGDTPVFAISGPNPGFAIDAASGELRVDTVVLDFETAPRHTISVTVSDDDTPSLAVTATITIDVLDVLHPPVATDDRYAALSDSPLVVTAPGVLGNDTDPDLDSLTVEESPVVAPAHGVVVLGSDGSFTYTPDPGFVGMDVFAYRIDDGAGGNDTASVTVDVRDASMFESLYLTSVGNGTELFFGSSPDAPADPVPDYDGDSNPGFTIASSDGDPDEADPAKYRLWTLRPAAALVIDGPVQLELWSTAADFQTAADVVLHVVLYDCAANGADCRVLIEHHEHVPQWNAGVEGWVRRSFDIGEIDVTIPPSRRLQMKLMFGEQDVWVASAGHNEGEASRLLLTKG